MSLSFCLAFYFSFAFPHLHLQLWYESILENGSFVNFYQICSTSSASGRQYACKVYVSVYVYIPCDCDITECLSPYTYIISLIMICIYIHIGLNSKIWLFLWLNSIPCVMYPSVDGHLSSFHFLSFWTCCYNKMGIQTKESGSFGNVFTLLF